MLDMRVNSLKDSTPPPSLTYLLVKDEVTCSPKGALQLKGIHKLVEAFEVVAPSATPVR
jgi:class 3 adenylate cyclase